MFGFLPLVGGFVDGDDLVQFLVGK